MHCGHPDKEVLQAGSIFEQKARLLGAELFVAHSTKRDRLAPGARAPRQHEVPKGTSCQDHLQGSITETSYK